MAKDGNFRIYQKIKEMLTRTEEIKEDISTILEKSESGNGDISGVDSNVSSVKSLLENGTYGLNALKNLQDTYDSYNSERFGAVQNSISSHDKNNYDRWADLHNLLNNIVNNGYYGINAIANWCNTHESNDGSRYNDLVNKLNTALSYNQPRYVFANFYNVYNEYASSNTFRYNFSGRGKIKIYSNSYSETFNVNLTIDGVSTPFILQNYSGSGKNGVFLEFEYNTSLSITFTTSNSADVQMWQYSYTTAV